MKILSATLLTFFFAFSSLSEPYFEETASEIDLSFDNATKGVGKDEHALGLTAGLLPGMGVSYRSYFENDFGFQVSGILTGQSNAFIANLAGAGLYSIMKRDNTRLYASSGLSLFYKSSRTNSAQSWSHTLDLTVGLGIGIEYFFTEKFSVDFSVPMQVTFAFSKKDNGLSHFWPIPSVGVYYYF